MPVIPVILSGGSGSRLWPRSRDQQPKQLLTLHGEHSLLQATALRLAGLPELDDPIVVCRDRHCPEVARQLAVCGVRPAALLEEPVGRNTAPAIAAAACEAMAGGDDPVLLIAPADHVIADEVALKEAVMTGVVQAEAGRLVTLGVAPTSPHTGYGYIELGPMVEPGAYQVDRFVEKPDLVSAQEYVRSGRYLWNSGILMGRASRLLEELELRAPDVHTAAGEAWRLAVRDGVRVVLDAGAFWSCAATSMEYAVMEHTGAAVAVPLHSGWNDIGSWASLWDVGSKDDDGNVVRGPVVTTDTRNTLVHAEGRIVAAVGIEDCVIVETKDAVLVAGRTATEDVKKVVERLRAQASALVETHRLVRRPWGTYEVIDQAPGSQVKRIVVDPGARLSLQRHRHRAEHWVVVRGTGKVTRDGAEFGIAENENVLIPKGATHRVENTGPIPLEFIEVQIGTYLGEDDIERFDDDYGRA